MSTFNKLFAGLFITILLTVFGLTKATAATQSEICTGLANIHTTVAIGRDKGMPKQNAMLILIQNKAPFDIAWDITGFVYNQHSEKSPTEIGYLFYNICMGEKA